MPRPPTSQDGGSTLWVLTKNGRRVECIVTLLPAGLNASIRYDEAERIGRIFQDADELQAWAEDERLERLRAGWQLIEKPVRPAKAH